jgi:hypothetical protein
MDVYIRLFIDLNICYIQYAMRTEDKLFKMFQIGTLCFIYNSISEAYVLFALSNTRRHFFLKKFCMVINWTACVLIYEISQELVHDI